MAWTQRALHAAEPDILEPHVPVMSAPDVAAALIGCADGSIVTTPVPATCLPSTLHAAACDGWTVDDDDGEYGGTSMAVASAVGSQGGYDASSVPCSVGNGSSPCELHIPATRRDHQHACVQVLPSQVLPSLRPIGVERWSETNKAITSRANIAISGAPAAGSRIVGHCALLQWA